MKLEAKSTTDSTEPQPQPQPQPQPGSPTVGISEALAKFLGFGGREMLLSEARNLVWEYVKANRLEVGSCCTILYLLRLVDLR